MKLIIRSLSRRIKFFFNPVFMNKNKKYSAYEIGEWTYGHPTIIPSANSTVKIGKFCSFAPGVKIYSGGEHRTDWVTTYPFSDFFEEFKHIPGHPA